jgi:hypothetical protein
MFNIDPLPVVAAVTVTVGIVRTYYKSKSSDDSEGCNGHHWQVIRRYSEHGDVAVESKMVNGRMSVVGSAYKIDSSTETAVLKEAVRKRCEDCDEIEYGYDKVMTVNMVEKWKNESEVDPDDCRGSE